ncbi:Uncharacterised protein [Bordetella pertussis]|nr:Uncharacterised protein [Bordetella pertussis]CFW42491.1 Uncharacterised protein [Bordetella pertussis]
MIFSPLTPPRAFSSCTSSSRVRASGSPRMPAGPVAETEAPSRISAAAGRAQPSASKPATIALLVFMTPPVWRLDMV